MSTFLILAFGWIFGVQTCLLYVAVENYIKAKRNGKP